MSSVPRHGGQRKAQNNFAQNVSSVNPCGRSEWEQRVIESDLSCAAKVLLWQISKLAARTGQAQPGQEYLAAKLGVTRTHIPELIQQAERAGFIRRVRRGNRTNCYLLPWHETLSAQPQTTQEEAQTDARPRVRRCRQNPTTDVGKTRQQTESCLYVASLKRETEAAATESAAAAEPQQGPVAPPENASGNLEELVEQMSYFSAKPVGAKHAQKALEITGGDRDGLSEWLEHNGSQRRRPRHFHHAHGMLTSLREDWEAMKRRQRLSVVHNEPTASDLDFRDSIYGDLVRQFQRPDGTVELAALMDEARRRGVA